MHCFGLVKVIFLFTNFLSLVNFTHFETLTSLICIVYFSNNVRNAATNALLNSLEFTKGIFEKDVSITQVVI